MKAKNSILGNASGYSIFEVLGVVMLCAILVPLALGILTEANHRLHPSGEHGRFAARVSQANRLLLQIQTDVDHSRSVLTKHYIYSQVNGDLILQFPQKTVVWHVNGSEMERITIEGDGKAGRYRTCRLWADGVKDWEFQRSGQTLSIAFGVESVGRDGNHPRTAEFETVLTIP